MWCFKLQIYHSPKPLRSMECNNTSQPYVPNFCLDIIDKLEIRRNGRNNIVINLIICVGAIYVAHTIFELVRFRMAWWYIRVYPNFKLYNWCTFKWPLCTMDFICTSNYQAHGTANMKMVGFIATVSTCNWHFISDGINDRKLLLIVMSYNLHRARNGDKTIHLVQQDVRS